MTEFQAHEEAPKGLQKEHPALQNTKFVLFSLFVVPFYPSWMRLREDPIKL
jgi:hypothetical protein